MLCYEIIPLLVWSVLTRAAVIMMELATLSDLDTGNITPNIPSQQHIYTNKKVLTSRHQWPAVARDSQKFRTYRVFNECSSSRILGAFDRNTIIFD